jgi:hypothetical protein
MAFTDESSSALSSGHQQGTAIVVWPEVEARPEATRRPG